jgi:hypothetical protein
MNPPLIPLGPGPRQPWVKSGTQWNSSQVRYIRIKAMAQEPDQVEVCTHSLSFPETHEKRSD